MKLVRATFYTEDGSGDTVLYIVCRSLAEAENEANRYLERSNHFEAKIEVNMYEVLCGEKMVTSALLIAPSLRGGEYSEIHISVPSGKSV